MQDADGACSTSWYAFFQSERKGSLTSLLGYYFFLNVYRSVVLIALVLVLFEDSEKTFVVLGYER